MSKDQIQIRDKVVQQLSRDGLVEENITKQTEETISNVNQNYQMIEPDTGSSEYDVNQNRSYHSNEPDTFRNAKISGAEQQTDFESNVIPDGNPTHVEKLIQNGRSKIENKKYTDQDKKCSLEEDAEPEQKLKESYKKVKKVLNDEKKQGLKFEPGEDDENPDQRIKEKDSKNLRLKKEIEEFELEDEGAPAISEKNPKAKERKGKSEYKRNRRLQFEGDSKSIDTKEIFKISDKQKELFSKNGESQIENSQLMNKRKMVRRWDVEDGKEISSASTGKLLEKNKANPGKGEIETIAGEKETSKFKEQRGTKLMQGSRYQKSAVAVDVKKEFQKKLNQQKAIDAFRKSMKNKEFLTVAKKALVKIAVAVKSAVLAFLSLSSIVVVMILLIVFALMYLLQMAATGAGAMAGGIYQSTYTDISDCEGYFRELETALEERLESIEDEYPGYYEYVYQLGAIEHDAVELMSYLATKYPDLTLEKSKAELESLFEERYHLFVEVKEEVREIEKRDADGNIIYDAEGKPVIEAVVVKICYITLEVKPWDQIMDGRLSSSERERYDVYLLSRGAQQVYGNPLVENWSDKITSNFGIRIHPITKEKKLHAGLDIAVPIGTPLYSCTDGIVTTSRYSDSAGNYIVVLLKSGYTVTYMHLDSLGVNVGDAVTKGMLIGETGNSGRSTGPHLHVEVRTEKNEPIDPTFIISNGTKQ